LFGTVVWQHDVIPQRGPFVGETIVRGNNGHWNYSAYLRCLAFRVDVADGQRVEGPWQPLRFFFRVIEAAKRRKQRHVRHFNVRELAADLVEEQMFE